MQFSKKNTVEFGKVVEGFCKVFFCGGLTLGSTLAVLPIALYLFSSSALRGFLQIGAYDFDVGHPRLRAAVSALS